MAWEPKATVIEFIDETAIATVASVAATETIELIEPEPQAIEVVGFPGAIGPKGDKGDIGLSGVEVVNHGTDPNVARPNYPVVYWVGTATPVNALPYDWYKDF